MTWGHMGTFGFDAVKQDLSSNVVNIFSNNNAFAALKSDGSVLTWGIEVKVVTAVRSPVIYPRV